jgi:localization factor PodJL
MPAQPKPELPNPAAREAHFDAAPREFHSAQPQPAALAAAAAAPKAISEILEPQAAPARAPAAAELPPDHPLEPGTRPNARQASPSERIAASENAISAISKAQISKPAPEPASSTNFIAAARRAAQAAAAAQATTGKANAKPAKAKAAPAITAPAAGDQLKAPTQPSTITSKIRSLLVGASVVMIVLGSFKMAMTVLDGSSTPPPSARAKQAPSAPATTSMEHSPNPAAPAPAMPSMTAPTPIGRQSYNPPAPDSNAVATIPIPQAPATSPTANGDITGSIPTASPKLATVQIPSTETLPDAIGGPVLRAAALKGDPTAAYEIGVRYAEGKGVTENLEEAAKWYDRAAQAGVVPAIFRLGTLYEKGMGVKKDTAIAQRYYLQAADRGNAKAMHNLAVLFADGGGNGSDYKTAAQWFRKAADRGIGDSQFNLGILYARGIGVEKNLAESYKWFSLAAAQGDLDAGHKRDEIAKQLDAQSLAAAKLAIQTFTPEPQPSDAINVATPPGGWDTAAGPATAIKPAKPIRRASR